MSGQNYTLRLTVSNGKWKAYAERQFSVRSLPSISKLQACHGICHSDLAELFHFQITPNQDLASLSTPIKMQPISDPEFDQNSIHATSYRVRFGIRYLRADNTSRDIWTRSSSQSQLEGLNYEAYLPTGKWADKCSGNVKKCAKNFIVSEIV